MRLLTSLAALALSFGAAQALEVVLDQKDDHQQFCTGMYSRDAWGGPIDPFIMVKFLNDTKPEGEDPTASVLIFEWKDNDLIGIPNPSYPINQFAVCDEGYVKQQKCNESDLGKYIVSPSASEKSKNIILTKAIHLDNPGVINYPIKKTGYYCVMTSNYRTAEYRAVAEFRNAYGELDAAQIPKLPFYGGMTIVYALLAAYWGFLYYQHRHDILAVQNYITAILVFLVVEMLVTWGFYDFTNRHGFNIGAKAFLTVVGILNAARNSFSFFLLLIVCMGYGVVKTSLGRTMIWARWLAAAHFFFGLVYSIVFLSISAETSGPFVILIVLPLVGTLTAFYVWTLNSLNFTLKDLRERKQHVKESMYKKLWWAILASIMVIFVFFFVNSFTFANIADPDYVPFHWKTRWFVLDGWLNLVYFADVAWVAYIWRPTANNRRFAMSDEIAQDDDGNFEFGDIGVPDDSDEEDEEAQIGKPKTNTAQPATGVPAGGSFQASGEQSSSRNNRPSLDGETIFAIGEDGDKFSDDGSDAEDAKLVRNK